MVNSIAENAAFDWEMVSNAAVPNCMREAWEDYQSIKLSNDTPALANHLEKVRSFFTNPQDYVTKNRSRPDLRSLNLSDFAIVDMVRDCLAKHPKCLEGAILHDSSLNLSGLSNVSLKGIKATASFFEGGEKIDFSDANLAGAVIQNITQATFCGANLVDANLTTLPNADFRPSTKSLTTLDNASLAGDFMEAKFGNTDLSSVDLIADQSPTINIQLQRPVLITNNSHLFYKKCDALAEKLLTERRYAGR